MKLMNSFDPTAFALSVNRRSFLRNSAYGLGAAALAGLLQPRLFGAANPARSTDATRRGVINPPHFPIRAKRIIHLCMAGGPSHLETLDWKPDLKDLNGKPFPESFTKGQQLAQLQNTELKARGPFTDFVKCGRSGLEISN